MGLSDRLTGSQAGTNVRNLASPFWRNALEIRGGGASFRTSLRMDAPTASETKRKSKVWFGLAEEHPPLFAFAGVWRPGDDPTMAS